MPGQTIALFRFQMLGVVNRRLLVLLGIMLLVAVSTGLFLRELTLINGEAIVSALVADMLRYGLGLLLLLTIVIAVVEDYETSQFERLLTMPLARWQYVAAQCLVIACLALILVAPVLLLMGWYGGLELAAYWAAAMWLELVLLGLLGLLAALSLEKIPQAFFFALAVYVLAKLSALIQLMLAESVRLSDGGAGSRAMDWLFGAILYIMPGTDAFADSDVFFSAADGWALLPGQAAGVAIYAAFLTAACLVDFYRKEFNL